MASHINPYRFQSINIPHIFSIILKLKLRFHSIRSHIAIGNHHEYIIYLLQNSLQQDANHLIDDDDSERNFTKCPISTFSKRLQSHYRSVAFNLKALRILPDQCLNERSVYAYNDGSYIVLDYTVHSWGYSEPQAKEMKLLHVY